VDWHIIFDSNFGDPFRRDKRLPGFGDHQLHMNPEDAKSLGINDGDYVYVDANPADRPFRGWQQADAQRAKVARLMLRVTYNTSYPRGVVMTKHAPFIATEKSVLAHETRPDGRAQSADTGYQANLRYGAQQSCTRNWLMPMHQTDTLFHKAKVKMAFMFGGEADNHAINTVPKETLVRVVKAEDGGPGGQGQWEPATRGLGPDSENSPINQLYLTGGFVQIIGKPA
jgi:nitrate reductase alpha subunit